MKRKLIWGLAVLAGLGFFLYAFNETPWLYREPSAYDYKKRFLALEYLDHRMISYGEVAGTGKCELNFSEVDLDRAGPYSCEDADATFLLHEILLPKVREQGMEKLLFDVEMQLRFLIALPLLIAAELMVHKRIKTVVQQFLDRGIIREESIPRFGAIIDSVMRLRNSVAIEVAILLVVYWPNSHLAIAADNRDQANGLILVFVLFILAQLRDCRFWPSVTCISALLVGYPELAMPALVVFYAQRYDAAGRLSIWLRQIGKEVGTALLCLLPVQLGVQTVILVGTSHRPSDPGWIAAAISAASLLIEIPYLANRHLRSPA